MAMKKRVSSLKDVPDEFHNLYIKKGGSFVLDLEVGDADPDADPEDGPAADAARSMKAKLKEFRDENIRLKQQMEQYAGIDAEEIQGLKDLAERSKSEEERALLQKGKFDEVMQRRLAAVQQDFERKMAAVAEQAGMAETRADRMRAELKRDRIVARVREAADRMKLQMAPTAQVDIVNRALSTFDLDEDGNVLALDGEDIRLNGKNEPYGPADFIMGLVEEAPHLLAGAVGADMGGGARGRRSRPGLVEIDPNDTKAFGNNIEAIASGKVEVRPLRG